MNKIFYVMGKSASGKDTIYKTIKEKYSKLKNIVIYTTRPMRDGEKNGQEYHFTNEETLKSLRAAGKVIEERTYQTVHGPWTYFTADDGQFDQDENNCIMIGTLVSYEKMVSYFGKERMIPIYIYVEDGERLKRAIAREEQQNDPKYKELCRRFLADEEDFSDENLKKCGIAEKFENRNIEDCLKQIESVIGKYERDNSGNL